MIGFRKWSTQARLVDHGAKSNLICVHLCPGQYENPLGRTSAWAAGRAWARPAGRAATIYQPGPGSATGAVRACKRQSVCWAGPLRLSRVLHSQAHLAERILTSKAALVVPARLQLCRPDCCQVATAPCRSTFR